VFCAQATDLCAEFIEVGGVDDRRLFRDQAKLLEQHLVGKRVMSTTAGAVSRGS
jgi:hypothetical protein